MTGEKWKSENRVDCVERAEVDIPTAPTRWRRGDDSYFGAVDGETWWSKDLQLNTNHEDERRWKFTSPIFGGVCSKGSLRQKFKFSVCSLFLTRICFLSLSSYCIVVWLVVWVLWHIKLIGPAVRVFANGPGDLGSIPGRVIPKTLKMVLDTTLLNTQHYKVRFKGKVEQSWEWSSALPYTLV